MLADPVDAPPDEELAQRTQAAVLAVGPGHLATAGGGAFGITA